MNRPSSSIGSPLVSGGADGDEIDLLDLFYVLWGAKWRIFGGGFLAAILMAGYSLQLANVYQASALLSPSRVESPGLSSQLGGLAGLAGIALPGGGKDSTRIALETLQSRKFLIEFVERRNIAPELLATTGYDLKNNQWQYDGSRYNLKAREWIENKAPNEWAIYRVMRDMINVNFDERRGLVSISLMSLSPSAASGWLAMLIEDLNQHLMEKEVAEAERSIAYLQQKLQQTALTEMREVFYQLIEQQTRTIMLARAKPEYALSTIDPGMEPRDRHSPKRTLMVVFAAMIGVIMAVMAVVVRQWLIGREEGLRR